MIPLPLSASRGVDTWLPRIHLPAALNIGELLRHEWVAYGEWVVGAVIYQQHARHLGPDAMVPLSSEFTVRHIPEKVRRPLLDDLLRAGVLECDGLFYFDPRGLTLGKCLCYRLGPTWRGSPLVVRPIIHPELLRKMRALYEVERNAITDPVHRGLREWHDQVEVIPEAPYGLHPLLDCMIDGERRFSVCAQGRAHTNVCNLPSWCRQYIRILGCELVSLDIATSQPLLLGLVLTGAANIRPTARTRHGKAGRRGREPQEVGHASFRPYSHHSLNDYLQDCLSGQVYNRIAESVPGSPYSRDEVKPLFLAVIYGEPRDMYTRVGEAVKLLYPAVFDAVVDLYRQFGHGGLARRMQMIESGVMIGRVAGRLLREHPVMPVLTVHDSILVPPGNEERVRRVICEEWRAEFDIVPRIKESWFTAVHQPSERQSH